VPGRNTPTLQIWPSGKIGRSGSSIYLKIETEGGRGSGVREEDTEDTARRDRTCASASKGDHMTIPFEKLKARLLANPKVKVEYDALALEFEISAELVKARLRAALSQAELAARMGTSQSAIARLESGQTLPSTKTLLRYAEATGSRFHVRLSAA
jgi:DNA-binding XRE family transcriptional regulator